MTVLGCAAGNIYPKLSLVYQQVCVLSAVHLCFYSMCRYGEGYVDVDEFLAAMLANSNWTRTKAAVRTSHCLLLLSSIPALVDCASLPGLIV